MYFDAKLWALTQGARLRMLACALLGLLALGAGIARFALLGRFLAELFAGGAGAALWWPLGGALAAVLLRGLLEHALNVLANRNAARIQQHLRARLYDKVVELGPAWFGAQRTGGVMLAVIDGVEQLQVFFGRYLPQLFIAACAPVVIFLFIAWWDWPVALVLLCAALLTLALPLLAHASHKEASARRAAAFKAFGEEFLDAIQGLPTLKAFGQSRAWGLRLAGRARALSDNTFAALGREVSTRFITDLGVTLGAAGALALGAWRVAQGEMSLAALLVVLMAGTEIFRPLRDLRAVLHSGMVGQSAAASVHALLEARGTAPARGGQATLPGVRAGGVALSFQDVRFAYPGGREPAHRGVDLDIAPGERIGIVGPSGAGKSTLVRLLLRLHDPESGRILIDGTDIRELPLDTLRTLISVVAQDSTLFHGSVADNLRLARPDATDDALREAARAANADAFIMALPQGYDTVLGERGTQLSGGQRQRLAIARALLRDTPILVLDEALSSVDAENEAEIQQALDRLSHGRTTLVLAHRLSSVIGADRIVVLDQGRIAESGTHASLMAAGGLYARLMGGQQTVAGTGAMTASAAGSHGAAPAPKQAATAASTGQAPAAAPRTRDLVRTLLAIIKPWRRDFAITVGSGVARVAAFIGVSVLSALIILGLKQGTPVGALAAGLFAAAILAAALHWLESWLAHAIAYRLLAELRIALYDKLEALAPSYLLRRRAGDLVGLAAQDVETVEYFYAHTVAPACVALLVPSVVLAVLGVAAWPLMLALLPFLLWSALSPWLARSRVDTLGMQARQGLGLLSAHLSETIQGLADLVAFNATGRRRDDFLRQAANYQQTRLRLLADLSRQSALLEVATGLGGLAVAATGAWWAGTGALDPGLLPLLILLATSAFLPVSEIAQVSRQLADTLAATRRLRAVHDEPVLVVDGPQAPPLLPGGLPVQFDHVRFQYPGRARDALRDISLQVPAGSTLALVGPSGAGKSTLASLLMRFWDPAGGSVRIGGTDLRELTLDALYARVALVAQDTWLLNGTLEDNIRLARPQATAEELASAVARAALAPFVQALPQGLATPVGERGVALSGGQRQRIAIARAFLRDAPVLVLDEATSHLDAISEAQVLQALAELMRTRTTLIIAHRLSTIRQADAIAVVDDGRIVELGTHDALLREGGAYARLVSRQTEASLVPGAETAGA